jgi:hypothetical protein
MRVCDLRYGIFLIKYEVLTEAYIKIRSSGIRHHVVCYMLTTVLDEILSAFQMGSLHVSETLETTYQIK